MRNRYRFLCLLLTLAAIGLSPPRAHAHPVPKESHDRIIVVQLARAGNGDKVLVTVKYRLEVDEWTVLEKDMPPFADEAPLAKFVNKLDAFYGEFTRIYAPFLAGKLWADIDSKRLKFSCVKREHTRHDEQGVLLGHLRCDFEFQASVPITQGTPHRFHFREGNYLTQLGKIDVSLAPADGLRLLKREVPSTELKERAVNFLGPGDDDRLRQIRATFELLSPGTAAAVKAPPKTPVATPQPPRARPAAEDHKDLRHAFIDYISSGHGFWLFLLLAAWIGAVHALTPGHGKTLIAAYLVGEHGTVWHALVLGLVTTFTHTAVVIAVALGLWLFYPAGASESTRQNVQTGLELAMGLLVLCAGLWLLLRRLAGKADHFHLGGHGHHHHHGHGHHDHSHADHDHDAAGHVIPRPRPVGWRGLVVMGMSGGIVPCWDAIAVLGVAVGMNMIWLALPLVLAFSAGLASVLVLIGILVVRFRGFAASRWGEGRLVRALPIVSAVAVTLLGFWLCYAAVNARPPQTHAAVRLPVPEGSPLREVLN
jgi:ABC-type nickel/cobalt efflux system permease component RcnA